MTDINKHIESITESPTDQISKKRVDQRPQKSNLFCYYAETNSLAKF